MSWTSYSTTERVHGNSDQLRQPATISGGNDQSVSRLDHNFSAKDRFTGRWFYSKTPQTDPFASPFPA
jgi:hypothetical protein